jgi:hypothetical protein
MKHSLIFYVGVLLLVVSGIMFVIAGGLFTANTITPLWNRVGYLSFWGCIPTGILGAIIIGYR